MSEFTALPSSPTEASGSEQPSARPGPEVDVGRPAPAPSIRDRVEAMLMRLPIGPGRLLVLVAAGLAALVVGVWLFRPPPPAVETTLPRAASVAAVRAATPSSVPPSSPVVRRQVIVDAAGAVARPGLYRLSPGARVNDLIREAGGLRSGADPDRLNLAAPLADGQRLYVPKVGELIAPQAIDPTGGGGGGSGTAPAFEGSGTGAPGGAPASPIDLNAATAQQLDTLPGVGPSTAASIIEYRVQHGPFHSIDDLLDVRGIGDAKLAALRAKVRV